MKRFATLAAGRADENDVAGSGRSSWLRLHLRNCVLHETEDRIEINGESGAPLLIRHVFDGYVFDGPNAVIGDEDIKASESFGGFGNHGSRGVGVGKITGDGATVGFAALLR